MLPGPIPSLSRSMPGLLKDSVDHLHDEPLLGAWQELDAFHLLLDPRDGAAPGNGRLRPFLSKQFLNGNGQGAGEAREKRHRHAAPADLVRGELRLRDTQRFGELNLGEIGFLAEAGDPGAYGLEEGAFVGAHGQGDCGRGVHRQDTPPSHIGIDSMPI